MPEHTHRDWNESYRDGDLPWDTGTPSTELRLAVRQHGVAPCRALDIGCGTGTHSVWLALQGFEVTGVDFAPLAVEQAQQRARTAGVDVRFLSADVLNLPDLGEPFGFFFDRGCYHVIRQQAPHDYAPAVAARLAPGARGLVLAGNANEPHDPGPPVVTEEELRDELGGAFKVLDLHEFRFDRAPGVPMQPLGWACFVAKR